MAKQFDIPDSFKVDKKVFITPRQGQITAQSIIVGKIKTNLIRASITPRVDLFPDNSVPSAMLGTPVYDQIIIKREIDSANVNDVFKFESALININQPRNIVKTPIQGRNGTVKEYISDGDYEISVRGIIASDKALRSPREFIESLHNLLLEQNEIVLVSDFIGLFKITYVVVENYNFSQIEGSVNQIQFDIKLISDEPVELKLGIDSNA